MTATAAHAVEPEEVAGTEPATARYEFDIAFQEKIAALLMRDTTFAQLTDGLVKPEFFENAGHASIVAVINNYFARYKKSPGDKTTIVQLVRDAGVTKLLPLDLVRQAAMAINALFETDISDRDFIAERCAEFARHQAVAGAILKSVDLIERRDFDQVGSLVRKALDTGLSAATTAYDYRTMVEARRKDREDRVSGKALPTGITTGYKALDGYLYHKGWGRRELSLLMGAAKAGKSMGLINFGVNAVAAGYRVLYVTLEVSSSIIADRMDANISDRAMYELDVSRDEVALRVEEFMAKAAPFIIHEFPTGSMKVSDLRRMIEQYKAIGTVFDLVIVDYADLMAPERFSDNERENSKSIYVDLRGLAMQEGFALLTATQTNREGAKKAVASATDVAEDFNKIRIADIVVSINKTDEERAMNRARLHFAASRNTKTGVTVAIEQDIDRAKFCTKILGEE